MSLLSEHFTLLEELFTKNYEISGGAGHGVNKGNAREYFVQQFLREHIGEAVQIGTGEIIDATAVRADRRNQMDLVLYRPTYPKLQLGGMINQFLSESIVATIEVKSKLNAEKLGEAIEAAHNVKRLQRRFINENKRPVESPKLLSYVVAFDAETKNMATILGWIRKKYLADEICEDPMPCDRATRAMKQSPAIDGVFIINKGFLYFDNTRLEFFHRDHQSQITTRRFIDPEHNGNWIYTSEPSQNNLLVLFLLLTYALNNTFDPSAYIEDVNFIGDVGSVISPQPEPPEAITV